TNLTFFNQPTGTGFSYYSDEHDIWQDEQGVRTDLCDFLQMFFAAHPELVKNDFYITNESYAGHCIPGFAARVHLGSKAKEGILINLKGYAIGLTDPEIQYGRFCSQHGDNRSVHNAGHMVLMDQPKAAPQTLKSCMAGKIPMAGAESEIAT
ncbi:S-adenosylmethionine synthase, partial [Psidium guajava]